MAIKFCTKCGKQFESVGREVICHACKEQAAEESKKAAVLKAKRASWSGESVPVRISGRASTVIRRYATANNMTFAESLDELLKNTDYFRGTGSKWEEVEPYRSHRRDKHATENKQDVPQDTQEVKQATVKQDKPVKPVKQAAKKAVKTTSTSKKGGITC